MYNGAIWSALRGLALVTPARSLGKMKLKSEISVHGDMYEMPRSIFPRVYGLRRYSAGRIFSPFSMLWELAKPLGRALADTWNQLAFRGFCGEGAFSSGTHFVMGNFEDVRVRDSLRSLADLPRGGSSPDFGDEVIYGSFSTNAATMLAALFVRHTGKLLRVVANSSADHKWDGTLICYGSSDWNLKTFDVETSSAPLCELVFDKDGRRAFEMGEQQYTIEERRGITYDKAILMRLTNRENPRHCYIVCAGLSEWGSLAAVYYLTKNWKLLHKRFDGFWRRDDFCVLLEVRYGQFEEATELASTVRLGGLV